MSWFLLALRKYATFEGRSRRSEYWYFVLFCLLIVGVLAMLDALLGTYSLAGGVGLLSGLFSLAMLVPTLAVSCRRLHDTGRSGWWLLIVCVPGMGAMVLVLFLARDSEHAVNEHGGNPKLSLRYVQPRFS